MVLDLAADLQIRKLLRAAPGALELATYASLAVQIEPELLRALRLQLAPHLDVGSEADLWHSTLVRGSSPLGFTFHPEVAAALRALLRDEVDRRVAKQAWEITFDTHRDTSPAIGLEEAIAWYAIGGSQADIDESLKRALRTMVEDPKRGLASWWMRARDRLPEAALASPVTNSLDREAMLQLEHEQTSATTEGRFERVLEDAGETTLLVRRSARAVELGQLEASATIRTIKVPKLNPVRVHLSWDEGQESIIATLDPFESEVVLVGAGMVRLKTERGDVYELPEEVSAAEPEELLPLADLLQSVADAFAREFSASAMPADDPLRRAAECCIKQPIEEFVDPMWRRALRVMRDRLPDLDPEPRFSDFALECLQLASRETASPRHSSRLKRYASELGKPLRRYDQWDIAGVVYPESEPANTAASVAAAAEIVAKAVEPGDPLERLGVWLEAHLKPAWHTAQDRLVESGLWETGEIGLEGFLARLMREVTMALEAAMKPAPEKSFRNPVAVSRQALEYLRRSRPDLGFFPEAGRWGYHLEGRWEDFYALTIWAQPRMVRALRALIDQRRAAQPRVISVEDVEAVTVALDGSGDFQSIQAAIKAVQPGTTLRVKSGVYREHVTLADGIELLGETKARTIIDGYGEGWVVRAANDCRIAGFEIRNSGSETGVNDCGILVEECSACEVVGNRIVNNGHYGIILRECSATISNNVIADNDVLGIYVDRGVEFSIERNQFLNHRHSAIDLFSAQPRGSIRNNNIIECGDGLTYEGNLHEPREISILNNIFHGNKNGITAPKRFAKEIGWNLFFANGEEFFDWSTNSKVKLGSSNLIADPKFVDAEARDFRLREDSPARGAGKDGLDIGALPYKGEEPEVEIEQSTTVGESEAEKIGEKADKDQVLETSRQSRTAFSARKHGFRFTNRFAYSRKVKIPIVGEVDLGTVVQGLASGMCFAALDYFYAGRPIPTQRRVPPLESRLHEYLTERQEDSLSGPEGVVKLLNWAVKTDSDIGRRSAGREFRKLRLRIDDGNPAALVLVRSGPEDENAQSHPVIASAYDFDAESKKLRVEIYDPNHPQKEVSLSMGLSNSGKGINASQSTGEPLRGFYVTDYKGKEPPGETIDQGSAAV